MRHTLFIFIACLLTCSGSFAQELYIGSFYVTSTTEESQYGDGADKWAKRMPVICDMFNFEQPDVLGLQSLTSSQQTQMKVRLTSYKFAEDILYQSALELDTCGTVSDMPEGSTCSWARLRKEGTAFYVFNACFSTTLSVATSSATRLRNAVGEINPDGLPCFVVGFMGSNEKSTVHSRMIGKFNDCFTKASVVSAEYGTKNDFNLAANHGTDRFDFVFASRDVSVKAYGQLQYGYFTQESDGTYKRRLPSTHFPVMAKVTLPQ